MPRLWLVLPVLLLGACANPYKTYYHSKVSVAENPRYLAYDGEPEIYGGTEVPQDVRTMREENYLMIGTAAFAGPSLNKSQIVEQAKAVKAAAVIHYSKYSHTVSGATPITVPDTRTSYHSGTVYGSGGGYASYDGTSTSYGTTTEYIPYSFERYDVVATFWAKRRPGGLGFYAEGLYPEHRRAIGSNKGIYVAAVFRDSAAYRADMLSGDILLEIDGETVDDVRKLFAMVPKYYGRKNVPFLLFRNGKRFTVTVDVDPQFLD